MRFTGKTVVVLGGNSGIGLAAARSKRCVPCSAAPYQ